VTDRGDRSDEDRPSRQTILAYERTQLAWWRTGLTAIAVALGVGRVLPDLAGSGSRWAYTVVGMGFALYGIAMIAYGTRRARTVAAETSGSAPAYREDGARLALTVAGVALGLAAGLLILFN
jgi:putative membrane protein